MPVLRKERWLRLAALAAAFAAGWTVAALMGLAPDRDIDNWALVLLTAVYVVATIVLARHGQSALEETRRAGVEARASRVSMQMENFHFALVASDEPRPWNTRRTALSEASHLDVIGRLFVVNHGDMPVSLRVLKSNSRGFDSQVTHPLGPGEQAHFTWETPMSVDLLEKNLEVGGWANGEGVINCVSRPQILSARFATC